MSIATDPTTEQLIAELYKIPGKAEIVDGRIRHDEPDRGHAKQRRREQFMRVSENICGEKADEPTPIMLHFWSTCQSASPFLRMRRTTRAHGQR